MSHVVPTDEADPVLRLVFADLAGEQGPHVELEERIAAAADREVRRQDGHERPSPPVRVASIDPEGRRAHRRGAGAAYCRTGPPSAGGGSGGLLEGASESGPLSSGRSAAGASDEPAAAAPASSISPTVRVALPSGRR